MKKISLSRNIRNRIVLVILAGLLLMAIDLVLSQIALERTVGADGKGLYLIRPQGRQNSSAIYLDAFYEENGKRQKKTFSVYVTPQQSEAQLYNDGADTPDETEDELDAVISSLNDDLSHVIVRLPHRLPSGDKVQWEVKRNTNSAAIFLITVSLVIILFFTRNSREKKMSLSASQSLSRQLPEFINRLVLLLNAGLVLNTALEKAIDQGCLGDASKEDYFQDNMERIRVNVNRTNSSICREFADFAKTAALISGDGAKELMRISNIINDNINKGAELTEKLRRESELLWLSRKRSCEERGRLAETKLTFPLTVFLLILVVITVSPALLEL